MIVYLAGSLARYTAERFRELDEEEGYKPYILQTFFDLRKTHWLRPYLHKHTRLMVDSGAFSLFAGREQNVKWESYVDEYADFVNEYDVEHFVELDVERLVGMDRMESLRRRLESRTGKQSIPVWHPCRGKDYYLGMCRDYKYIAFGAFITDGFKKSQFKYIPWFIDQAHSNGARIHGLGFTQTAILPKYRFDSVDSKSWLVGNYGSSLPYFTGSKITYKKKPEGKRVHHRETHLFCLNEWIRFQRYAKEFL